MPQGWPLHRAVPVGQGAATVQTGARRGAELPFQPRAPLLREGACDATGDPCFCMAPSHLPSVGCGCPEGHTLAQGQVSILAEGKCEFHYILGGVWN